MVDRVGGFHRADFQGFGGVTQVDPMSPTISNVLVDSVVRRWILLVEGGGVGQDGWRR